MTMGMASGYTTARVTTTGKAPSLPEIKAMVIQFMIENPGYVFPTLVDIEVATTSGALSVVTADDMEFTFEKLAEIGRATRLQGSLTPFEETSIDLALAGF
jgi:hypothetical protein